MTIKFVTLGQVFDTVEEARAYAERFDPFAPIRMRIED